MQDTVGNEGCINIWVLYIIRKIYDFAGIISIGWEI